VTPSLGWCREDNTSFTPKNTTWSPLGGIMSLDYVVSHRGRDVWLTFHSRDSFSIDITSSLLRDFTKDELDSLFSWFLETEDELATIFDFSEYMSTRSDLRDSKTLWEIKQRFSDSELNLIAESRYTPKELAPVAKIVLVSDVSREKLSPYTPRHFSKIQERNFEAASKEKNEPGIYYLLRKSVVVYVGQSTKVKRRLKSHVYENSKKYDAVKVVYCTKDELSFREAEALAALRPEYNKAQVRL
jgi:predicted GIY-YIG superfamily endonuclease